MSSQSFGLNAQRGINEKTKCSNLVALPANGEKVQRALTVRAQLVTLQKISEDGAERLSPIINWANNLRHSFFGKRESIFEFWL